MNGGKQGCVHERIGSIRSHAAREHPKIERKEKEVGKDERRSDASTDFRPAPAPEANCFVEKHEWRDECGEGVELARGDDCCHAGGDQQEKRCLEVSLHHGKRRNVRPERGWSRGSHGYSILASWRDRAAADSESGSESANEGFGALPCHMLLRFCGSRWKSGDDKPDRAAARGNEAAWASAGVASGTEGG